MNTIQTCPICHKTVKPPVRQQEKEPNFFPFCSERCKLIDLGTWLEAGYKVVSSIQSQESDLPSNGDLPETDIL